MDSTTVVWIVVAIAAVIVIAALVFAARNRRNRHKHVEAERIREDVTAHITKVDRREALADETAARARAAEAEAEAKAAEAARLSEQAAGHREAVAASREDIDERCKHADQLDPKTPVDADHDGRDDAEQRTPQESTAWREAERK